MDDKREQERRERGEWTQTVRKTKERNKECRYKGKTPDLLLLLLAPRPALPAAVVVAGGCRSEQHQDQHSH